MTEKSVLSGFVLTSAVVVNPPNAEDMPTTRDNIGTHEMIKINEKVMLKPLHELVEGEEICFDYEYLAQQMMIQ